MSGRPWEWMGLMLVAVWSGTGCSMPKVDLATIHRPERSAKLDAYNVFVGKWNWTSTLHNAMGKDREWTGQAEWSWTLDGRALRGKLSAASGDGETTYEAEGFWSWHPKRKRYIWWMFNNWGYPEGGTARYDEEQRRWTMNYRTVGLDGTTSYGRHVITVRDENTLDWTMEEWADPLHTMPKMRMTGTCKRRH